ncbi:MAG: primosomal protein N' [Myxococcales bacterium]|nr:primosomal protein N' [Myxococcales bacterium]
MRLVEVAVFAPVAGSFTYALPDAVEAAVGARVWVRFGGRSVEGVVVSRRDGEAGREVHRITGLVDGPSPDAELTALGLWVAEYYLAPPGEALRLLLPSGGRARDAARVALTVAGRRAAEGIGRALEPQELDGVGLRERVVLEKLLAAGGESKVSALEVEGARAAVKALAARELIDQASLVEARRERAAILVTPRRAPVADEPVLARSPRRRALLETITGAGPSGEIALADLRALDPGASAHVKALVAAGLCSTREAPVPDPFIAAAPRTPPPSLNADQTAALARIAPAIGTGTYAPFLLHGITGSGKTEVYLHAIAIGLARGLGALALVPEISLTPQLAARFRARFGDEVAVLHSGLGERERFDAWVRLRTGRVRIALGARSAVFAPVRDLGVVVIDEEHDGSFKQEEGVRYHGRDVAMRRARAAGVVAILGSATPSLETYHAAREGRIALCELPRRATPRPLPSVEVIDLRRHQPGEDGLLSVPLTRAIEQTLTAREQVILFLNRRGFSTFVICKSCGYRFSCRDCSVTLTYHRRTDRLACHYCGYLEPAPTRCTKCQSKAVERLGMGTEKVESLVAARFPNARVARLDRDSATGKGLNRVLDGLRDGVIDLVVGTQMITKGHDFPGVTLVGVVLADHGMGLPDFRASERTFQLLAQVAGRAGRGERPGRVILQTFDPSNPAVACARDHDYHRFFRDELKEREELGYPPFSRLGAVRVEGVDPARVQAAAEGAAARARAMIARAPSEAGLVLNGPSEAPLGKLRGRTRWHLLLRAKQPRALRTVLAAAVAGEVPRGVRLTVDVDPVSML